MDTCGECKTKKSQVIMIKVFIALKRGYFKFSWSDQFNFPECVTKDLETNYCFHLTFPLYSHIVNNDNIIEDQCLA